MANGPRVGWDLVEAEARGDLAPEKPEKVEAAMREEFEEPSSPRAFFIEGELTEVGEVMGGPCLTVSVGDARVDRGVTDLRIPVSRDQAREIALFLYQRVRIHLHFPDAKGKGAQAGESDKES